MCVPAGWENFDASPTLFFERLPLVGRWYTLNKTRFPQNARYGNIVKGLAVPPGSCAAAYASHVLEHLALEDFRTALRHTFNYLRPGGIFRLVVPVLEAAVRTYLKSSDPDAAEIFLRETFLGRVNRPKHVFEIFRSWIGNSDHL
jgi:hypothetical protein